MNKLQLKMYIGALTGSLVIGGATHSILNKITGRTIVPFTTEIIKEYGINQRVISVNYTSGNENTLTETKDKYYILEKQTEKLNAIEIKVHSPYFNDENNMFCIKHYQYIFKEPLSINELEEKIKLLESRNFAELIKDCDYNSTQLEVPIILPEENIMKAEMIINSIDYNDIKSKKQSLDDDFIESMILTFATLIGGGLGSIVQETIKLENEIIKMDEETIPKKKIKKKEKKSIN